MNEETALATNNNTETELMAPSNTNGLQFTNPSEFPDLDGAEAGVSLEMKYYEFLAAGEIVRAIYNGVTQINKKDQATGQMGHMNAAVFQTREGVFLNSGDNLMSQLQKLTPGTPIQITFEGKQKTASGNNVNKFSVRILNLKGAPSTPLRTVTPPATTADEIAKECRAGLFDAHAKLWVLAQKQGLIVPENIKNWKVDASSNNEEIETRIALMDAAVNF